MYKVLVQEIVYIYNVYKRRSDTVQISKKISPQITIRFYTLKLTQVINTKRDYT